MFKKTYKNFLIWFLLLLITFSGTNCYLFKQGIYIINYNSKAVSVDTLLKNPSTNSELTKFLILVKEIRKYAIDSIGLKNNNNYSRYVKTNQDYLVNVLSACDAVSFNQYQWCFPFFGCVPYKGFFERKDAEREAKKLSDQGKDVNIDKVDAFSTLGIFSDPVYSFMRSYSEYRLASVIIHEQTHATIFIKNQISFNEETATFIGNQGAINFIKQKYGEGSEQYKNIFIAQMDHDTYLSSLRNLYRELKQIYESENYTKGNKLALKNEAIAKYKENIRNNYDSLFKTQRYRQIDKFKINNAFLSVRMTYSQNLELFNKLYAKKNCNLKATLIYLKQFKKLKHINPEELIKSELNK